MLAEPEGGVDSELTSMLSAEVVKTLATQTAPAVGPMGAPPLGHKQEQTGAKSSRKSLSTGQVPTPASSAAGAAASSSSAASAAPSTTATSTVGTAGNGDGAAPSLKPWENDDDADQKRKAENDEEQPKKKKKKKKF